VKWWKIVLAVLGGLFLALAGVAVFLEARREVAYDRYRRRKRELEEERARLSRAEEKDRARLAELDRQIDGLKREFLLQAAASREEMRRIREMTPEEVAHETTRLENLLRERLGVPDDAP